MFTLGQARQGSWCIARRGSGFRVLGFRFWVALATGIKANLPGRAATPCGPTVDSHLDEAAL